MEQRPERIRPEEIPASDAVIAVGRYPTTPIDSLVLPDDDQSHIDESVEALKALKEERP